MDEKSKLVLGLDLGATSVGYYLIRLHEGNRFDSIIGNSIIFPEYEKAEDRRKARASRRLHERSNARKKFARRVFVEYGIADSKFIDQPTKYIESLKLEDVDVYKIREGAVRGENLSKDEFLIATYSILTDRGYNNMFNDDEDEDRQKILAAIAANKKKWKENNYPLPSMSLNRAINGGAIRNKKGRYINAMDREMHKEEFEAVVNSQKNNTDIFKSTEDAKKFLDKILNENTVNAPFYQRPLKSFENMVAYCSHYNKYHPKIQLKRGCKANISIIEFTLRQAIDNYGVIDAKTGEIKKSREVFTSEEITKIVNHWISTPKVNKITVKNIFKEAGFKGWILNKGQDDEVLDIKAHRIVFEIFTKYDIDFVGVHREFYNETLRVLHDYKNHSVRVEKAKGVAKKYNLDRSQEFFDEVAKLSGMDGFGSFSIEFAGEIIDKMKKDNLSFYDATTSLGYGASYLNMPKYKYLPPLNPTQKDIEWMKKHIEGFDPAHLYYQPMMSPTVKRVISIVRKLINKIIEDYGEIDEIRIESLKSKMPDSKKDGIKKLQAANAKANKEAEKYLTDKKIKVTGNNIIRARLLQEQNGRCPYSGETITDDEAFDEQATEVEHFIPRGIIWINNFNNRILVKTKQNRDKSKTNPVEYLKNNGRWETFVKRVQKSSMSEKKKKWLTDEDAINARVSKEGDFWQDRYLNDTRSAARAVQKYLNHYLFPKANLHGTGESRGVFAVSGKAISDLKRMWGIDKVIPRDDKGKKDRSNNYHHTFDALTVALCSNDAINALHTYISKNDNYYKNKASMEKVKGSRPYTVEGIGIGEYIKAEVEKYESNEKYITFWVKKKNNVKGFKDGNKKIIIKNIDDREQMVEVLYFKVGLSLLSKKVGMSTKDRTDKEVKNEWDKIKKNLDPTRQKKIIEAVDKYIEDILDLRKQSLKLNSYIRELEKGLPKNKKTSESQEQKDLKHQIKELKKRKEEIDQEKANLLCQYETKKGKRVVRKIKYYSQKQVGENSIIMHLNNDKKEIRRLTLENLKYAKKHNIPYNIQGNDNTLSVSIFEVYGKGQIVGLNYFNSLSNKIDSKTKDSLANSVKGLTPEFVLRKYDLLELNDLEKGIIERVVFNGGGNVSKGSNRIEIKPLNHIEKSRRLETLNKKKKVKKISIDILGNIIDN